jgi:hypothetical protein
MQESISTRINVRRDSYVPSASGFEPEHLDHALGLGTMAGALAKPEVVTVRRRRW